MEGKMRPDNLQIIGGPESLNTSRTEIAPGSHVVRENFQRHWLWHINTFKGIGEYFLHCQVSTAIACFTATRSSGQHTASLWPVSPSLNSPGCRYHASLRGGRGALWLCASGRAIAPRVLWHNSICLFYTPWAMIPCGLVVSAHRC